MPRGRPAHGESASPRAGGDFAGSPTVLRERDSWPQGQLRSHRLPEAKDTPGVTAERLRVAGSHRWAGFHHTCVQRLVLALVTRIQTAKGLCSPERRRGPKGTHNKASDPLGHS